ncbi:MAG: PD-(D/E)XK nuclease family protein [Patescibacteria group bacterium]|nr:PD-(D/E)XK nuclease family protein [Patescibacteria group bacterium]
MSKYYNSSRTKNIFDPLAEEPFKLSRSKIDLFIECPRCFYLDRRLGVSRPPSFPFNLNSAVDLLLKKEFDIHRAANEAHPLMKAYGLDLVPLSHEKIDEWRENFKGVQFFYEPANMILTGAVDDIWVDKKGTLYVVDYKSTSKETEVDLNAAWQIGYKRQMEFYQWLLRKNGFDVSDTGYFVYCNGRRDVKAFDAKLEFDVKIIPYKGSDKWVEITIMNARDCLLSDSIPPANKDCDYCNYREAAKEKESLKISKTKKSSSEKIKIQEALI